MANHLGYLSLALYVASFICYARILYVPQYLGGAARDRCCWRAASWCNIYALLERSRCDCTPCLTTICTARCRCLRGCSGITYLGLELFHRQRSVGAFVTLLLVVLDRIAGVARAAHYCRAYRLRPRRHFSHFT